MEEGYTSMNGSRHSGTVILTTSPSSPVATYNNQPAFSPSLPASGYLTPTSPTDSQPPQLPAFPTSFGQPVSRPSAPPRKLLSFPRADSGIEADSPRSPSASSPTGTFNPTASTLYEYIDPNDVHLDSQGNDVRQMTRSQAASSSSGISSTAPYSGDVVSDSEDGTNQLTRRRVNPMYEALQASATRLYAETCHCKVQSSAQRQLRYLWCSLIVLIIFVIFLLCVIAYILFMLIPGVKSNIHDQEDRIVLLETGHRQLQQQNAEIEQLLAVNNSNSSLSHYNLADAVGQLNSSVWSFSSRLDDLRTDLHQQITNISLIPGPQGPAGAGNVSSCFYRSSSSYQALPGPYSTTSWQPDTDILQDNMVMSAACKVIGGTEQFIEAKVLTPNAVRYRCRCDGNVDSYDRRLCHIHLVLCPRIIPLNLTGAAA